MTRFFNCFCDRECGRCFGVEGVHGEIPTMSVLDYFFRSTHRTSPHPPPQQPSFGGCPSFLPSPFIVITHNIQFRMMKATARPIKDFISTHTGVTSKIYFGSTNYVQISIYAALCLHIITFVLSCINVIKFPLSSVSYFNLGPLLNLFKSI